MSATRSRALSGRIPFVFFGTSHPSSLRILRAVAARHRLVGIVEALPKGARVPPPWRVFAQRLAGRDTLSAFAASRRVSHHVMDSRNREEVVSFIRGTGAEVGCVGRFRLLLPRTVLDAFPLGVLNVHPSLLPKYRGADPIFWEYWNGEREGGVTVHFVDEHEDTGDIVKQETVPIQLETPGEVLERQCDLRGGTLLADALSALAEGNLERRPQRADGSEPRSRRLQAGERPIDWATTPLEQVYRALCGATTSRLHLLPPLPEALALTDWIPAGYQRQPHGESPGQYRLRGHRLVVTHAEGRIWLRPRLSLDALRRLPRQVSLALRERRQGTR